jgi:hypothetical protein
MTTFRIPARLPHFAAVILSLAAGAATTPQEAEAGTPSVCAYVDNAGLYILAGGNDNPQFQVAQNTQFLVGGSYFGQWKDGTNMLERITFGEGYVSMQRLAGGHGNSKAGPVVLFTRTGASEYTNANGSKIQIVSPTTFTWRNKHNGNMVFYQKIN